MDIKNIIFDFGGVLLNLDISKTEAALLALVGDRAQNAAAYQELTKKNIFTDFEIGAISSDTFVAALQAVNPNPTTKAQIEMAWSSMLLDFPPKRIELLKELKAKGFNIYILSNINEIHLRDVRVIIQEQLGIDDFDSLFDGVYYSHLIECRKPHVATYEKVLSLANIKAAESVFIDDTASNLIGARQAGLHTIHHKSNSNLNKRLAAYLDW